MNNRRSFIVGINSTKLSSKEKFFLKAISNVVKSGMDIVGVSVPEKM